MSMGIPLTVPSTVESFGDYIVVYMSGDTIDTTSCLMMVLPIPGAE